MRSKRNLLYIAYRSNVKIPTRAQGLYNSAFSSNPTLIISVIHRNDILTDESKLKIKPRQSTVMQSNCNYPRILELYSHS